MKGLERPIELPSFALNGLVSANFLVATLQTFRYTLTLNAPHLLSVCTKAGKEALQKPTISPFIRGGCVLSPEGQKKAEYILSRYPIKMNAVLPMLHLAQRENNGYLTAEWMEWVAEVCEVPPTHVEGVATFYTMFKLEPPGKFHLQICTNLSCGLCGGEELLEHVETRLQTHAGHTTEDGQFSIEEMECLGACGYAPVMIVNEDFHEKLTLEAVDGLLDQLEKHDTDLPAKTLPLAQETP